MEEQLGNKSAAAAAYKKCLTVNPAYFRARLNLGILYYKSRMYGNAIKQFRLASRLKPSNAAVSLYLGQVYDDIKNPRSAIRYYRAAFLADPNNFPGSVQSGPDV